MTTILHTPLPVNTSHDVQRVLWWTLLLNLAVALCKIVVGVLSGALSILADGIHSLVDGASNVVGLFGVRLAHQPPDADHPYGHQRFETVAALTIGVLLLMTALEVVQSAWERLVNHTAIEMSPLVFAVLIATVFINVAVNRYQCHEGRRLRSQILLADAANTGADVFVTLAVLAGMVFVQLGWAWADAVSALIVVGFIARAAFNILTQTGRVLVDTAPYTAEQLQAQVQPLVAEADGQIIRARSRGTVEAAFIDIDICVAPHKTVAETERLTQAIRKVLHQHMDGVVEVEVHFTAAC
jgi:cation diffusion facilitator family transporter